ncbi:MAG: hypothetical protein ACFCVE_10840 [Phycisphaerae bacterium]
MPETCLLEPHVLAAMPARRLRDQAAALLADDVAGDLADTVGLLTEADRPLAEMVFCQRLTYRDAAERLGIAPSTVCRRAARIRRLLADPLVRALAAEGCCLPPALRRLGVAAFVRREPVRQIAAAERLTRGRVQAAMAFLRGWSRGQLEAAARTRRLLNPSDEAA